MNEKTKIKFNSEVSDGTIINVKTDSIFVKASDGIIKITKIRNFKFNELLKNQILK